jgi:hypothetical protein
VTIGQSGVGTQVTNSFINMAYAMLVAIGLVYMIMVVLFGSLRVPLVVLFALLVFLVTFFALPLAVIGAFVALALTGRALDLSVLIVLLMLPGTVVTTVTSALSRQQPNTTWPRGHAVHRVSRTRHEPRRGRWNTDRSSAWYPRWVTIRGLKQGLHRVRTPASLCCVWLAATTVAPGASPGWPGLRRRSCLAGRSPARSARRRAR